jgi:hypothetical protein
MTKAGQSGAIRDLIIRRDLLAILENSEWWDVDGVESRIGNRVRETPFRSGQPVANTGVSEAISERTGLWASRARAACPPP